MVVVGPAGMGITDVGSYITVVAVTLGYTAVSAKTFNSASSTDEKLTQFVPTTVTSAQPWQLKDSEMVTVGSWPTSYTVIVLTMPSGGMQEVLVRAV